MKRTPSFIILLAFLVNSLGPLPAAHADEFLLPAPGVMVHLSPEFNPPILKGIKVDPDNPFRFEFILDKGESVIPAKAGIQDQEQLKTESTKLIKYFLATLTTPEKDLWVNLSPYEKDRIIPQSFGLTEMGRDLLAEDYMLKQITASLIYPEDAVGKKFWKRIYEEAQKKFGTTNIPVNTFNKVWIVPEKAVVYENAQAGTAYVVESRLKVMLEQDYLALSHNVIPAQAGIHDTSSLGNQIVREIVIPELTREVNEDKNFSQLRQVYNSLILATWYKKKIKDSILEQVYADKKKVAGVQYTSTVIPANAGTQSKNDIELIYQRYLKAFKKGVYNYIKEDVDPATQETIPRKYFSGGFNAAQITPLIKYADAAQLPSQPADQLVVTSDLAMLPQTTGQEKQVGNINWWKMPFNIEQDFLKAKSQRNIWEVINATDELKGYRTIVYPLTHVSNEFFFYVDIYKSHSLIRINSSPITFSVDRQKKIFLLTSFYPNFPQRGQGEGFPRAVGHLKGRGQALLKELLRPFPGYMLVVHMPTGYLPNAITNMDLLEPVSVKLNDPHENVYGRIPEINTERYQKAYGSPDIISEGQVNRAQLSMDLNSPMMKERIQGLRDELAKNRLENFAKVDSINSSDKFFLPFEAPDRDNDLLMPSQQLPVYEYKGLRIILKSLAGFPGKANMNDVRELSKEARPSVVPLFFLEHDNQHYFELDLRDFGYQPLRQVINGQSSWFNKERRQRIIDAAWDALRFNNNFWFIHGHLHTDNILVKLNTETQQIEDVKTIDFKLLRKVSLRGFEYLSQIRQGLDKKIGALPAGLDLEWIDLDNFDLRSADLRGRKITGCSLRGAIFRGPMNESHLEATFFDFSDMENSDFTDAVFKDTFFENNFNIAKAKFIGVKVVPQMVGEDYYARLGILKEEGNRAQLSRPDKAVRIIEIHKDDPRYVEYFRNEFERYKSLNIVSGDLEGYLNDPHNFIYLYQVIAADGTKKLIRFIWTYGDNRTYIRNPIPLKELSRFDDPRNRINEINKIFLGDVDKVFDIYNWPQETLGFFVYDGSSSGQHYSMESGDARGVGVDYKMTVEPLLETIGSNDLQKIKDNQEFITTTILHELVHRERKDLDNDPELNVEIPPEVLQLLFRHKEDFYVKMAAMGTLENLRSGNIEKLDVPRYKALLILGYEFARVNKDFRAHWLADHDPRKLNVLTDLVLKGIASEDDLKVNLVDLMLKGTYEEIIRYVQHIEQNPNSFVNKAGGGVLFPNSERLTMNAYVQAQTKDKNFSFSRANLEMHYRLMLQILENKNFQKINSFVGKAYPQVSKNPEVDEINRVYEEEKGIRPPNAYLDSHPEELVINAINNNLTFLSSLVQKIAASNGEFDVQKEQEQYGEKEDDLLPKVRAVFVLYKKLELLEAAEKPAAEKQPGNSAMITHIKVNGMDFEVRSDVFAERKALNFYATNGQFAGFIYTNPVKKGSSKEAIMGIYVDPIFRGWDLGRSMIRTLLESYPNVSLLHKDAMNAVLLRTLMKDFSFEPHAGAIPNAYYLEDKKKAYISEKAFIRFLSGEEKEIQEQYTVVNNFDEMISGILSDPKTASKVTLLYLGEELKRRRDDNKNTNIAGSNRLIKDGQAVGPTGGIDLTPANMHLQTQNGGDVIKFHLDPAMLEKLQNAPGFTPVIINIQPLNDLKAFLGIHVVDSR